MITTIAFAVLVVGAVGGLIQQIYADTAGRKPRCPVCGYLKSGPLHNDQRCDSVRGLRLMTADDEAQAYWHSRHEEELGF